MTLILDARQRAMLEEMGVKVWLPKLEASPLGEDAGVPRADLPTARSKVEPRPMSDTPASAAPSTSLFSPERRPPSSGSRQTAPDVAPAPQTPARSRDGSVVALAEAPVSLYSGAAAVTGGWLVVADLPPEAAAHDAPPPDAAGDSNAAMTGEAGRLLDNMLRALQLHRGTDAVHLVRVHRGPTTDAGDPSGAQPLADAFASSTRALAPRVVLALGPISAAALLQSNEPLGRLRGRVGTLPPSLGGAETGTPLIASYAPEGLLRRPADKAKAWADLCLAADAFERATG